MIIVVQTKRVKRAKPKRDFETEALIRCIRDYDPSRKVADLRKLSFAELGAIYTQLRGY